MVATQYLPESPPLALAYLALCLLPSGMGVTLQPKAEDRAGRQQDFSLHGNITGDGNTWVQGLIQLLCCVTQRDAAFLSMLSLAGCSVLVLAWLFPQLPGRWLERTEVGPVLPGPQH